MNFICWKLDAMAPFLYRLLGISYLICHNKGDTESNSHYIKFCSRKKESIKCTKAMSTLVKSCMLFSYCSVIINFQIKINLFLVDNRVDY